MASLEACLPFVAALFFRTTLCRQTRSEEHTSELQSQSNIVCRLLLEKKQATTNSSYTNSVLLPTPMPLLTSHDSSMIVSSAHQRSCSSPLGRVMAANPPMIASATSVR